MDALLIMVFAFIGYILMYQLYGKYIGNKIFALSADAKMPSVELEDGIDYVPTKKEVIFGHHFTSIAGTGPIVGPAIAIIWGCQPDPGGTGPDYYHVVSKSQGWIKVARFRSSGNIYVDHDDLGGHFEPAEIRRGP